METIVEEDEKDVKMYERESIQSKQNIKKDNNDNDNDDIKKKNISWK